MLWHDQFEDLTFEGNPSANVVATNDNDPGTLVVVQDVEWIHRLMQGQNDKG